MGGGIMNISTTAFEAAARRYRHLVHRPNFVTYQDDTLILEYCLTEGMLKIHYCRCGTVVVTLLTIDRPTEDQQLTTFDLERWGHDEIADYIERNDLSQSFDMTPEDMVNLIVSVDSRHARTESYIRQTGIGPTHHDKNS
jgi:hypothetical protein